VLRLYTRSRYDGFQDFTVPEITRVQLTDVCLFARFLLPHHIRLREFFCSLPDSPPTTSVLYAIDILQQIGALDNMQKVMTQRTLRGFDISWMEPLTNDLYLRTGHSIGNTFGGHVGRAAPRQNHFVVHCPSLFGSGPDDRLLPIT
jgi:hypothetical protein